MEKINGRYAPFSGKIVACIPAYNAARSIGLVVSRAKGYVDEVIVVNDGSTDNTGDEALKAGAKLISHSSNQGYGASISSCLRAGLGTNADIIITLDSDLQHNPDEIPLLVQPIIEGLSDIVTGSRFTVEKRDGTIPDYRRFGITLLTRVTNFMANTGITDVTTGFRAYSKEAAKTLTMMRFSSDMGASPQILIEAHRSGLRIKEIQVNISYRTGFDTSTQNAVTMGMNILTSIIRYIAIRRPLSLIGVPGLAVLALGVGGLFFLLDIFAATRTIPTGLGMFTVATVVIGLVMLLSSFFLYSLSSISKQIMLHPEHVSVSANTGSKKTSLVRYITIKRPLSLIGIPGLAVLALGVGGLFFLLDIFSATRTIPTGLGMFTVATVVIGLFLLMTSVVLYSVSRLINK